MLRNMYPLIILLTITLFYILDNFLLEYWVLYSMVSLGLLLGFYSLIKGSDIFIDGASGIAKTMNISEYLIGLTLVAFATSLPEFAVSVIAAISGVEGIVIGNIIGSNIANIGLILGVPLLITKIIPVRKDIIDAVIMIGIELILFLFIINDGVLQRYEGATFLMIYLVYLFYLKNREEKRRIIELGHEEKENRPLLKHTFLFSLGAIGVIFGANLLIKSSVIAARLLGVSEYIIGITIVAVGTSLPELATTIASVIKRKSEIMMGNIIGSNILNIVLVLGFASILNPIITEGMNIITPYLILFVISSMLILFMIPKETKRYFGALLLIFYIIFIYLIIL